jgi:hypothetical protein
VEVGSMSELISTVVIVVAVMVAVWSLAAVWGGR